MLGLLKKEEEEEERRMPNYNFFTSRGAYINCAIIAMLYTHSIGNQPWNTMVVFKMHDSVPSMRYSSVCKMYWVYGESRSFLLIEYTDSMLCVLYIKGT